MSIMDRWVNLSISIGVSWVSLVICMFFFSLVRPGIGTRWKAEPAPPEQVSRLRLGGQGEILAQSDQGIVYEFQYGSDPAWDKVTAPSGDPAIGASCSQNSQRHLVLPPPGKVISRVGEDCVYIETAYHLEVALLENGEVWLWEHEAYAYTDLFVITFLCIAFVSGVPFLMFGLGMKIYRKLKTTSV
jgi:hypothetical protein